MNYSTSPLYPLTAPYDDAESEMVQALSQMEDDAKIRLVKTSGPSKLQMQFKNADIYMNVGNRHKEAYQFFAEKGQLHLVTRGETYQISEGCYTVIDRRTGKCYRWSSAAQGTTDSDILLFERKRHSIRFGVITQASTELTWEDPIVFMFLGIITNDTGAPCVIFSAGVGGPKGFGGMMVGNDPHIVEAALGAYYALGAAMQGTEGNKESAQEKAGEYDEQVF